MPWREDLVDADINGAPFEFRSVGGTFGPRTIIHEPATSDLPIAERLPGRRVETFDVEAFVIGDEYLAAKDRLMSVLENDDRLVFRHPYRGGDFRVEIVGPIRVSESQREGGMARFQFTLARVKDQPFPLIRDTGADLDLAAGFALDALADGFGRRFSIGAFIQGITNAIGLASSAMNLASGKIAAKLNLLDNLSDAIGEFFDAAGGLLSTPGELAQGTLNTILNVKAQIPEAGADLANRVDRMVRTAREIGNDLDSFSPPETGAPSSDTPEAERERDNVKAYSDLMRAGSTITTAGLATSIPFENNDQIDTLGTMTLDQLEVIMFDPDTDDATYDAIVDLRAKLVAYLNDVAQRLPDITDHTVRATIPALALAYDLYTDATRDLEIVERNRVRHPGTIDAGTVLRIEAATDG